MQISWIIEAPAKYNLVKKVVKMLQDLKKLIILTRPFNFYIYMKYRGYDDVTFSHGPVAKQGDAGKVPQLFRGWG